MSGSIKPINIDREKGLYGKYRVERIGGTPGKHRDCYYYVLDLEHDAYALPALRAYADVCETAYPALAHDLRVLVENRVARQARLATADAKEEGTDA